MQAGSKAIQRELRDLQQAQLEGVRVVVNEFNLTDIQAEIEGPLSTPYEGGVFRVKLILGDSYPDQPPKGLFTTKIFHPNVSPAGEICVNVLKRDWTPQTGIKHVLCVVRCLLIEPNPDSALNEEAGRLLQEDYEEFAARARLMTSIHAQARRPQGPLTTSGGNVHQSAANIQAGKVGSAAESAKQQTTPAGGADGPASPAMKRAKSEQVAGNGGAAKAAPAASKAKKSLKRL